MSFAGALKGILFFVASETHCVCSRREMAISLQTCSHTVLEEPKQKTKSNPIQYATNPFLQLLVVIISLLSSLCFTFCILCPPQVSLFFIYSSNLYFGFSPCCRVAHQRDLTKALYQPIRWWRFHYYSCSLCLNKYFQLDFSPSGHRKTYYHHNTNNNNNWQHINSCSALENLQSM